MSFTQLRADCAINPPTLAAGRLIAVWAAQPEPGLWRWRLEHWNKKDGNGVTERFKWLAQSAAARLGFAGGNDDAVSFWLDQIKRDAPESHLREFFVEEEESNQLYAVEILDICGLSADYCWKCEAEEIMSQAVSAKTTSGFPPAEQEIGGFGTQHGFAEGVDPFQENGRPLGENPFPQEHPVHAAFEEATWKSATRIAQYKLDFMRANCPNKQEFLKSILTFRKRWFTTVAFEATLIVGDEETAHWYEHWIGDRAKWLVEDTLAKVKRKDPNAGPASPPFFSPKDIEFIGCFRANAGPDRLSRSRCGPFACWSRESAADHPAEGERSILDRRAQSLGRSDCSAGIHEKPVIQATTHPLNRIQTGWRHEHEAELKNYERAKEEYELRRAGWKEEYKKHAKRGTAVPNRPEDEAAAPTLRRLIVNDSTFEALHQTMSENPAGILVIRDELTGWWSQLDRAGREGERAFCLQAWNGDTGHTIDRIGRGTVHVEACCMSMLGGIQPGRLRSYLSEALADGPSNDGLIQRFQVLVWPDTEIDWQYIDRQPNAEAERRVAKIFQGLVELDPMNPLRFRFCSKAQDLFVEWSAELEAKVRGDEVHPALVSHLSKYRKLMPALALLFELADSVAAAAPRTDSCVSLEHTAQAAEFCGYLETHANRIYSCVTTPQMRAAQVLAEKIKKRKVGANGFFTGRDVYVKGWSGLDSPEAARLAAHILLDADWIREQTAEAGPLGGRPSTRYQVNPRVGK